MCQQSSLGLDIDGVITSHPEIFSILTKQFRENGGKVYIVSSRSDTAEVVRATKAELNSYDINFDSLYLLPSIEIAQARCPESDLDWYQKYLWQKVEYCLANSIDCFYDDDAKVVDLFRIYAPQIRIFHVGLSVGGILDNHPM